MRVLALIPARAGSRRLPGKNIAPLCGRPLIYWTLCAVPPFVERITVSTDGQDITDYVSMHYPHAHIIKRPDKLSTPQTQSIDVVRHAIKFYDEESFDAVLLLQPTSPLRTQKDITDSIATLEKTKADAVVSVTDVEAASVFEIGHAGRMRPIHATQSADCIVVPNGAIFLITTEALERGEDWWTCPVCYAHLMPPERSIDIDTEIDLEMAQAAMERVQHAA